MKADSSLQQHSNNDDIKARLISDYVSLEVDKCCL